MRPSFFPSRPSCHVSESWYYVLFFLLAINTYAAAAPCTPTRPFFTFRRISNVKDSRTSTTPTNYSDNDHLRKGNAENTRSLFGGSVLPSTHLDADDEEISPQASHMDLSAPFEIHPSRASELESSRHTLYSDWFTEFEDFVSWKVLKPWSSMTGVFQASGSGVGGLEFPERAGAEVLDQFWNDIVF